VNLANRGAERVTWVPVRCLHLAEPAALDQPVGHVCLERRSITTGLVQRDLVAWAKMQVIFRLIAPMNRAGG